MCCLCLRVVPASLFHVLLCLLLSCRSGYELRPPGWIDYGTLDCHLEVWGYIKLHQAGGAGQGSPPACCESAKGKVRAGGMQSEDRDGNPVTKSGH